MHAEGATRTFLLLTLEYPPDKGGVASYLSALVRAYGGHIEVARGPFFGRMMWPHWLRGAATAYGLVRAHRPAMIWVSHVLPMGYIALIMRACCHIPYVVFTHGLDVLSPEKSRWKKWWMRRILQNSALVVANSKFTAQLLYALGIPETRVHLMYPTGDAIAQSRAAFAAETGGLLKQLADTKIILSVGRLVARKGQLRAVRAIAPLLRDMKDVHYVIVGDGPDRGALSALIHELGLSRSVHLTGAASDEEREEWYRHAAVFLLPTVASAEDAEGFGMVFVEASMCGVPVVAGRGGGVDEAVRDGYSGFLIDGSNEEEVRAAVARMLLDAALRRRLGEQGRVWAAAQFRLNEEADRLKKRIDALLPALPHAGEMRDARRSLVSVIIPAYNHAKELARSLRTLERQTYGPLEVIVSDDGSEDGAEASLASEPARWSGRRSFVYVRGAHRGASHARNTGLAHARGNLIIFWDADVHAEPQMIETLASALQKDEGAAFAYSSFYFGWKKFACGPFDPERLKRANYITTTSLIRREFFPGFDESLTKFQDWDVWLTISERGGRGVWVSEPLFRLVPRKGGMSRWLPSWAYRVPFLENWAPVKSYRQGRARIYKKHSL